MTASAELVGGNFYDKYHSRNPVARILIRKYFRAFNQLLEGLGPQCILEVGCGEGEVLYRLDQRFPTASASGMDLSYDTLLEAKRRFDTQTVVCGSASNLPYDSGRFDLVVCVEVLEHVLDPERVLRELRRVASGHLLVSVPQEPLWRILNMARGAYWTSLGNTPGHLHHWSSREFRRLLEGFFRLEEFVGPMPWSLALCRPA